MTQIRHALRRLSRAPGFTLTTLLTLAIGIGATTAIFSVVNGILLKPLPFPEPDRLIAVGHRSKSIGDMNASPALYLTYREHNRTFESIALWWDRADSVTGAGDPEQLTSLVVTHEFLSTLRVAPLLGRSFVAADDELGAPQTVILSYGYWQRRFGGAADALGKTMTINGTPHAVIGVLPQSFRFLQRPADILVPAGQVVRMIAAYGPMGERAIARLKPGVTLADVSADIERMIPIAIESYPGRNAPGAFVDRYEPSPRPLKSYFVGDLGNVLWVLMGTIAMLLAVACANVANLHLARTENRGQELAIRAALGASRGNLARSVLLESTVLGVVGGALGVALATVALPNEPRLFGTHQAVRDARSRREIPPRYARGGRRRVRGGRDVHSHTRHRRRHVRRWRLRNRSRFHPSPDRAPRRAGRAIRQHPRLGRQHRRPVRVSPGR